MQRSTRSRSLVAATTAALLALTAAAAGAEAAHHRLAPEEIDGGDQLGTAVALDGDRLLLGAVQRDPEPGVKVGAAFLYAAGADGVPALQHRMAASDGGHDDHFGNTVAIAGDAAVVGAMFNSREGLYAGTVHVYEDVDGDGDVEERILRSPGAIFGGRFGWDMEADGRAVVIGAPNETVDGFRSGRTYLYVDPDDDAAWSVSTELLPSTTPAHGTLFGEAVALDHRTIVVGAPGAAGGRGRVHVFHNTYLSGWVESAVLAPADLEPGDAFGDAVAIHGDTLVVGAPGDDDGGTDAGIAYVFTRTSGDGWAGGTTLAVPREGSRMGLSVAVDGSTIAVGAPRSDLHDLGVGAVHVFTAGDAGWQRAATLVAYDAQGLGWDVAVQGERVLAGAPYTEVGGHPVAGVGYLFPAPWEDYDALEGTVDQAVEDGTGVLDRWVLSVDVSAEAG